MVTEHHLVPAAGNVVTAIGATTAPSSAGT
jgi:hypothetical protein